MSLGRFAWLPWWFFAFCFCFFCFCFPVFNGFGVSLLCVGKICDHLFVSLKDWSKVLIFFEDFFSCPCFGECSAPACVYESYWDVEFVIEVFSEEVCYSAELSYGFG